MTGQGPTLWSDAVSVGTLLVGSGFLGPLLVGIAAAVVAGLVLEAFDRPSAESSRGLAWLRHCTPTLVSHVLTVRRMRRWRRGKPIAVAPACTALAAELRTGAPPATALRRVAKRHTCLTKAGVAAGLHGDVAAVLHREGRASDSAALLTLSACWQVAAHTGAGLAAGADPAAQVARSEDRIRAEVQQELAGPRATARLLGLLPVLGIGLGALLGAQPLSWLLGSGVGRIFLVLGLAFMLAGHLWVQRIIARALPAAGAGRR